MDKKNNTWSIFCKDKETEKNHAIQNFIYQYHTGKTVNCIQGSV